MGDSDDMPHILTAFISQNHGKMPSPTELANFSRHQLTRSEAETMIDSHHERQTSIIQMIEYKKQSKQHIFFRFLNRSNLIVFIIWLLSMIGTLFGVSYGLIHIGFGYNALQESNRVSKELCNIYNVTTTQCQYENVVDLKYDYILTSAEKCHSHLLHRREQERDSEICGIKKYDIGMNVSCFIGDCHRDRYSFVSSSYFVIEAQQQFEVGCIVLIATVVPFVSFICWISFCYQCQTEKG